jgi:transketolase
MRNAFAKTLTELALINKNIILLTGDIGNKLFDDFKKKFPNRFYNCGVAEANMVGVAAGLAKVGFIPFVYTITPFLTSRCFEQIRLDVCYPNEKVFIVGTGSGLSYSRLGPTHHSLEDISLMSSIPNLKICCPGDSVELNYLIKSLLKKKGPTYLRLGKKGEPIINKKKNIIFGKQNIIIKGKKIIILSVGNMLGVANDVFLTLKKKKISAQLVSFHSIKPINMKELRKLLQPFYKILILEEHNFRGGLSSFIKSNFDILNIKNKKIYSFCVKDDIFFSGLGEQQDARKKLGLDSANICKKIIEKS